jgi:hypothetical protein
VAIPVSIMLLCCFAIQIGGGVALISRRSLPSFNSSHQAATNFVNTKAQSTTTGQIVGDD